MSQNALTVHVKTACTYDIFPKRQLSDVTLTSDAMIATTTIQELCKSSGVVSIHANQGIALISAVHPLYTMGTRALSEPKLGCLLLDLYSI